MFGFGKDKKRRDSLEKLWKISTYPLGIYITMRALGKHLIDGSELEKLEREIFECAYIYGIVMGSNYYVDKEHMYITHQDFAEVAISACKSMKLFKSEKDAEGTFEFILNSLEKSELQNVCTTGAEASIECISSAHDENGQENAFKKINLNYFEDKKLIKNFKKITRD